MSETPEAMKQAPTATMPAPQVSIAATSAVPQEPIDPVKKATPVAVTRTVAEERIDDNTPATTPTQVNSAASVNSAAQFPTPTGATSQRPQQIPTIINPKFLESADQGIPSPPPPPAGSVQTTTPEALSDAQKRDAERQKEQKQNSEVEGTATGYQYDEAARNANMANMVTDEKAIREISQRNAKERDAKLKQKLQEEEEAKGKNTSKGPTSMVGQYNKLFTDFRKETVTQADKVVGYFASNTKSCWSDGKKEFNIAGEKYTIPYGFTDGLKNTFRGPANIIGGLASAMGNSVRMAAEQDPARRAALGEKVNAGLARAETGGKQFVWSIPQMAIGLTGAAVNAAATVGIGGSAFLAARAANIVTIAVQVAAAPVAGFAAVLKGLDALDKTSKERGETQTKAENLRKGSSEINSTFTTPNGKNVPGISKKDTGVDDQGVKLTTTKHGNQVSTTVAKELEALNKNVGAKAPADDPKLSVDQRSRGGVKDIRAILEARKNTPPASEPSPSAAKAAATSAGAKDGIATAQDVKAQESQTSRLSASAAMVAAAKAGQGAGKTG